jgi:hypothetical protein
VSDDSKTSDADVDVGISICGDSGERFGTILEQEL